MSENVFPLVHCQLALTDELGGVRSDKDELLGPRGVLTVGRDFLSFAPETTPMPTVMKLCHIAKIVKLARRGKVANRTLALHFKTFRKLKLTFRDRDLRRQVFELLCSRAFPLDASIGRGYMLDMSKLPYFMGHDGGVKFSYDPLVSLQEEMGRIMSLNPSIRMTSINEHFNVCQSYPPTLLVPNGVSDILLQECAKYRSKARIPVITWTHPETGVTLSRSSQPKPGLFREKSSVDIAYLDCIRHSSQTPAPMVIIDARPKQNALANQAVGAGFELVENYHSVSLFFMNIQNIHIMRDSMKRLSSLCTTKLPRSEFHGAKDEQYLRELDQSGWLGHIQQIMTAAVRVVTFLNEGNHVLIHCSDGWDRTPLIASLAKIMMDGYYRTFHGLRLLLENEWLAYGHRFQFRMALGQTYSDTEESPTLLQFFDCIYQLTCQFPWAFQFKADLLVDLMDSILSCEYGNFMCNSYKERMQNNLYSTTPCAWTDWNLRMAQHINPAYSPNATAPILARLSVRRFSLWMEMYCRWDSWIVRHLQSEATPFETLPDVEDRYSSPSGSFRQMSVRGESFRGSMRDTSNSISLNDLNI